MRPAVVLRANLAAGCGLLAWVLYRFGGPTLGIVTTQASPARLAGLACVAATVVVTFAWRLELAGLGPPLGLSALALYRAAGESLAALAPSARIGGDPLRAWLAERERVPSGHAIASVAVDRTLEMGAGAPFGVIFATVLVQHGIPGLQEALVTVSIGA